jgi:NADH-quinone oxidoreductase subunit C
MNFNETENIALAIKRNLHIKLEVLSGKQSHILIDADDIVHVCKFLKGSSLYFFDFLNAITGVDLGLENDSLEINYTLSSLTKEISVHLKVRVPKAKPEIESVSTVWASADWHEREVFDFFGINFLGHKDLRRILLPADWEGFPLRKDYEESTAYHSIKIKY